MKKYAILGFLMGTVSLQAMMPGRGGEDATFIRGKFNNALLKDILGEIDSAFMGIVAQHHPALKVTNGMQLADAELIAKYLNPTSMLSGKEFTADNYRFVYYIHNPKMAQEGIMRSAVMPSERTLVKPGQPAILIDPKFAEAPALSPNPVSRDSKKNEILQAIHDAMQEIVNRRSSELSVVCNPEETSVEKSLKIGEYKTLTHFGLGEGMKFQVERRMPQEKTCSMYLIQRMKFFKEKSASNAPRFMNLFGGK